MAILVDRRRLDGQPDPEAREQLRADRAALRELQIRIAKTLARVEEKAAFIHESCASIMEYGVRLGYDASETRRLCDLGLAMAAQPDLEEQVRQAKVPLENAAEIGRVLPRPDLVRPGEKWMEYARLETPSALRRRVRRRLAEAALKEVGISEVTFFVTEKTLDEFGRCRDIASRKAGKSLTNDQAFGAVVGHYLDHEDPMRRKPGKRRMPDTSIHTPGASGPTPAAGAGPQRPAPASRPPDGPGVAPPAGGPTRSRGTPPPPRGDPPARPADRVGEGRAPFGTSRRGPGPCGPGPPGG